ncbi:MAG: periplasmic heavy metal sensor [Desulfobulbaceae bacterium]|nr:periplasmic heavy metal sensor [Desulfobulbaceae bacterium]
MKTTSKKNLLLAALLATGVTFGLAQTGIAADATATPPAPTGAWDCPWMGNDPAMVQKHNKFLQDTVELRKQMAVKHAEKRSLMRSAQPDSAKVAQLTGELFDLREQLRAKAQTEGLPMGMMGGGMGMGRWHGNWGPCDGMGPGGMGQGRGGRGMGR